MLTKKKLMCEVCDKAFLKPSQLMRHLRIHTGERPFKCSRCEKSFNQKGTLEAHVQTVHEKLRPFVCEICNCKFAHRGNLRVHQKNVHCEGKTQGDLFRCEECPCVFQHLAVLNNHVAKTHARISQITSTELENTPPAFTSNIVKVKPDSSDTDKSCNNENIEEVDFHTDSGDAKRVKVKVKKIGTEKFYLCTHCSKTFKKPSDLIRHTRIHTKEKPFTCDLCPRTFAIKSTLKYHVKTHRKTKRWKCKFCYKTYSALPTLRTHERFHKGESIFENSEKVSHPLTGSSSLSPNIPETVHHEISESYDISKGRLPLEHLDRRKKDKPFQCPICNERFSQGKVLNFHITEKCQVPDITNTTNENLEGHAAIFSEVPQLCSSCGKIFGSEKLLNSHVNECGNEDFCAESICNDDTSTNFEPENEQNNENSYETQTRSMGIAHQVQRSKTDSISVCEPSPGYDTKEDLEKANEVHSPLGLEENATNNAIKLDSFSDSITPTNCDIKSKTDRNQCDICKKVFKKHSDLGRHNRIHTGDKPFQCLVCGRQFRVKSTCVTHMRTHASSNKTVSCNICKKDFATRSSLKVHVRLHTGARPYKCVQCNRDFRTTGHLQAHTKSHLRQKSTMKGHGVQEAIQKNNSDSSVRPSTFNHYSYQIETNFPTPTTTVNVSEFHMGNGEEPRTLSGSESECLKLIGSLQLPIENLQNIQITSVDMNSIQVEDLFQKILFVSHPVLAPAVTREETISWASNKAVIGNFESPQSQSSSMMESGIATEVLLGLRGFNNASLEIQQTVSSLDPFLTEAVDDTKTASSVAKFNDLATKSGSDKQAISKQCPVCGRIFSKPSQMLRHQRIHTGEKPHACTICQNTFTQKSSLDTHIMFAHSEVRPFQCSECPFKTVQKAALKKHCSRAHPQLIDIIYSGEGKK